MIEYVNLVLLLAMFGSTCYVYYKLKKFFYFTTILMDSEILDQLTNLEKNMDSEVTKPKRGRKKKIDIKINEVEENDVRDKRERLVVCTLSVTQNNIQENNTLNSKLMEWTVITLMHCQIDTNLF